jgi:mannan endo-1,4-beta-mannosidase
LEPWTLDSTSNHDARFTLASIIAGRYDTQLRRQAQDIAAFGDPLYLRFAHEMNGNWYPWAADVNGNTAPQYATAWRHVHQLFAQMHGGNARWVWSATAVNPGSPAVSPAPFYPGDHYVDFVGLTGYEHNDPQPAHTFSKTITELRSFTGRKVILSEIGTDGPNKRTWLANLGTYILGEHSVAGFVYFHTTPASTGATGSYALQGAPDLEAFRRSLTVLKKLMSGTGRPKSQR